MTLTIPIRTVSETNAHEHWRVRAKRAKAARGLAALLCRSHFGRPPALPLTITLTRIAPRQLDQGNHESSHKHIQDGIADWLACHKHDANPGITWRYEQRKGAAYAVEVQIVPTVQRAPGATPA